MKAPAAYRWAAGLALVLAAADQGSKWWILNHFVLGERRVVIAGFFDVVYWRNTGAAWGMFAQRTFWLGALSFVVLALMAWQFYQLTSGRRERVIGLALVLGGIVGNLIDRVGRGAVVDFLLFYYRTFQWPAFNIADSAITAGVFLYVVSVLLEGAEKPARRTTAPETP